MRVRACAEPCWPSAWEHLHPIPLLSLGTQLGTPQAPGGVWDWDMPGMLGWGSTWRAPQPASSPAPGWVTRWDRLVGARLGAGAAAPQPCAPQGELGWVGAIGWAGLPVPSDSACPPPRGHLCNGLSTEKQQSNPSRALLGCQLPFL